MFKRIIYQVLTGVACSLGAMCLGMLFVWPSYTLPMLAAANSTILSSHLTATEEAMLGSLPSLGAAVGSALVGMLMEAVGRKMSSLLMTMLFVISWCTIGATTSATVMLVARFVGGLAGGATMVINPVYVAETAEDNIRGSGKSVVTFFGFGTLISYFIGWYCNYHTIAWVNLSIAFARGLLVLCVPESPVFLMKKNKIEEARISISIYRGCDPNSTIVQEEILKIKQQLSSHLSLGSYKDTENDPEMTKLTSEELKVQPSKKFVALKTLCDTSPASRRAFTILFVAFTMETAMGLSPVQVYAKTVFIQADPSRSDLYSVILAICWCTGACLCSAVADKLGRRVMLITSACTAGVCLFIIGLLLQTQVAPPWVTVVFIMLFCFCFQSGSGCVPYVLLCEMFCPEVQTLASMLIVEWLWITAFVILALFNWLRQVMGIHVIFYIFAINSFLYATFSYYLLPETKGLSNKQIQLALLRGRRK